MIIYSYHVHNPMHLASKNTFATCRNTYYAFQDRALFQFPYIPCVDIKKRNCSDRIIATCLFPFEIVQFSYIPCVDRCCSKKIVCIWSTKYNALAYSLLVFLSTSVTLGQSAVIVSRFHIRARAKLASFNGHFRKICRHFKRFKEKELCVSTWYLALFFKDEIKNN